MCSLWLAVTSTRLAETWAKKKKCLIARIYFLFTKIILTSHHLFGAVSKSYSPHLPPNKTYNSDIVLFFFLKLTVPLGLGPLLTNSPLSWHNENTACKLVSQNPSVFGHRRQASTCIFQLMETRKYILIGHKAKLSKPRTKNKMKGKSLVFAQVTHSQICLSRCWSGDNCELTRLWGCLE